MQAAIVMGMAAALTTAGFVASSKHASCDMELPNFEGIVHNDTVLSLVKKLYTFRDRDVELFDAVVDHIDELIFRWHQLTTAQVKCDKYDGPDAYMMLDKTRSSMADFIRTISPQLKPRDAVYLQQIYDELSETLLQVFLVIMKRCRNIDL